MEDQNSYKITELELKYLNTTDETGMNNGFMRTTLKIKQLSLYQIKTYKIFQIRNKCFKNDPNVTRMTNDRQDYTTSH